MEQAKRSLRDKPLARWGALALISLTMFFAYMFVDVLSPLKTLLETELGWDSTVFGLYGGSEFFLDVFVGFLIFAGIILDKMGVRFTALLSGSVVARTSVAEGRTQGIDLDKGPDDHEAT